MTNDGHFEQSTDLGAFKCWINVFSEGNRIIFEFESKRTGTTFSMLDHCFFPSTYTRIHTSVLYFHHKGNDNIQMRELTKHAGTTLFQMFVYAVKAQTSLAPLSRFRGSHITAHEQQCCRFQSYAKTVPSPMKFTSEIDKAWTTFLGSMTTDHVIRPCDV